MKKEAKYIASVSLGVMGAGFVATLPFGGGGSMAIVLLQGGFEAGVVGGLADWFAVSALFRHPLGIPIPHTALLPKNRDKITNALVTTVENELLSKETIRARLKQIGFLQKALELSATQLHNDTLHKGIAVLCKQALLALDWDQLGLLIKDEIRKAIQATDMPKMLHHAVKGVAANHYDAKAFDFVLDKVDLWAVKADTRDQLGAMAFKAFEGLQVNGFMQFAVNAFMGMVSEEKLGGILQDFILSYTEQLRTERHPKREGVLSFVREELFKLEHQPKLLAELESWKERLPELLSMDDKLEQLLAKLRERADAFVDRSDFVPEVIIPLLERLLNSLQNNQQALQRGEHWIQQQISEYVERNHNKIGLLVKENLDKLDNDTLIEMMEDKIGGDLQWIRVNGAICGFLIGLALTGLKLLV
jgi:uncharacterized membrane-anchored protein YjiN (DUF445 family)